MQGFGSTRISQSNSIVVLIRSWNKSDHIMCVDYDWIFSCGFTLRMMDILSLGVLNQRSQRLSRHRAPRRRLLSWWTSRQSKHEVIWRQVLVIKVAASSPPSSSASRIAHSHQMSSLSINTFSTVSQLDRPLELLLPGAAAPHTALAAAPTSWHFVLSLPSGFVSISDLLSRPRERGYWEHMGGACGDGGPSLVNSCQSLAH
ncbi:hypothetical protein BC826DRAFT_1060734, partial [Russula brevipes]